MITYCTNAFPGESWEETFANIRMHQPLIKAAVSPAEKFPIGLRLSDRASREIDASASASFLGWCAEQGLFVPTINGFSYGPFHAVPVKEAVYSPDWRYPERAAYTKRLASLLLQWLPGGMTGSLSTLPVCFKKELDEDEFRAVRRNIVNVLEFLDGLRQAAGKEIVLALEPEPCCYLETMNEAAAFVGRLDLPDHLRTALGLCYDCCHQAIEFEDPGRDVALLAGAGIRIAKVHVSSAPHLGYVDRPFLENMAEQIYLHQVVIRGKDGVCIRYKDIPEMLDSYLEDDERECRVHFHIPVFLERYGAHRTTRAFIEEIIPLVDKSTLFEIETYTWNILSPDLRGGTLHSLITRELQWLESVFHASNRCA